jgi:hypothetical protein
VTAAGEIDEAVWRSHVEMVKQAQAHPRRAEDRAVAIHAAILNACISQFRTHTSDIIAL